MKATPDDKRRALNLCNAFIEAGILFVPMPVTDESDLAHQKALLNERLDAMRQKRKMETKKYQSE